MQFRKEKTTYSIVLSRGEEVIATLGSFCKEHGIEGGFFMGLGAVENPIIAHYSVPNKKYSKKTLMGAFELTALTGSIGIENDVIVHAHVTLSDEHMQAFGGHLIETAVGATVEIILFPLSPLIKTFDSTTGLKLFNLHPQ